MKELWQRVAGTLGGWEARYRVGALGPFAPTRWVWSRGLALSCDHHGGEIFVRGQRGSRAPLRFEPRDFERVKDGDLVWMRLTALPQFLQEALPRIGARFALLTGDEDWSIPGSFAASQELLDSPKLVYWFSQNLDQGAQHPKLQVLPIGLDFHTISNGPRWGHEQATPAAQEAELDALRAQMPPTEQRLLLAHADFHFNKHKHRSWGDDRDDVQRALTDNPSVVFQPSKLKRLDLWREKTRYAFVVSPHGNGLDCHRTWESLVLGNIVIVKRSSIDALYEGLPVVIVDDFREIDAANLRRWHAEHAASLGRPQVQERLTNRYWIERARRMLSRAISA
ncbi:MAG TPA: hypothetical protein VEQ59_12775 [Polyangiaceae bacterium]|nr:hypothetical protein [Polyangiaceae bacterium]